LVPVQTTHARTDGLWEDDICLLTILLKCQKLMYGTVIMSRLSRLKANINEDDMANNWGAAYVEDVRVASGTKLKLDAAVRTAIPTFRLMDMLESGTSANDRAISVATDGCYKKCLFGMGSYAGGVGVLHDYSTTDMLANKQLSLVKDPENCLEATRKQTVPLPYHIPHDSFTDSMLERIENKCLEFLNFKLVLACLEGTPYKVFLLEYILSGCGAELTIRFLLKLAKQLKQFNVSIIADEVMTAGRVGPSMTITSTLPEEFTNSVEFITLGKAFGCGIVLEKVETYRNRAGRGTTTTIEPAEACTKFAAIQERLERGFIETKRKAVIAALKLSNLDNELWGRGLLMFSSKKRNEVVGNLRCRLLPSLENGKKTKLRCGFALTTWDRKSVNDHLLCSIDCWLQTSSSRNEESSPYTLQLAKYLVRHPSQEPFEPADVVEFIKLSGVNELEMIAMHRKRKREMSGPRDGRCKKSHVRLIGTSLKDAERDSHGFLSSVVRSKRRCVYYQVRYPTQLVE
jgi:hypothetical protein